MASEVIAASLLTAGLRSDFKDNYMRAKRQQDARLKDVMQLDVPSDKLTELFAYPLSAPHMRRWPRGKDISEKNFASVAFQVTNKDWGHRIRWHRNDRADDQTGSLYENAQNGGKSGGVLDERCFFQILTGATDNDLLESVPNAPDGAALFATTANGSARFGATDGNLLTSSGVTTGAVVRTDFWLAMSQFARYQDTESQPLYLPEEIDQGAVVIYGPNLNQVMREAFLQSQTVDRGGGGQAVSNTIVEAGQGITLWQSSRITDNDWFVFLKGAWRKPIFSLNREELWEKFANMDNSDVARDTGVEYIQWGKRKGYGVNLPFGAIKINS